MKYFLFIICVTFLLYQSIDLLNEFMSGKTVTTIAYGIIRNTTLPAITLCLKSLDFSKLAMSNQNVMILYRNYLREIENSTASKIREVDSYWLKTYWGALAMYFNSTSPNININKYILKNLIPFTNQMNETILKVEFHGSVAYGEINNDLILIDEYLNQYNDHSYRMISTPMESLIMNFYSNFPFVTKCYTLFSHSHSLWNNITIAYKYLSIDLTLDPKVITIRRKMSIPIIMHSPNALPLENFNSINPGYHYNIRFSQWNIERLGKGYDTDCREYEPKNYTRSDCILDCYQDKVKYHCHTKDIVGSLMLIRQNLFDQRNLNLSKCRVSDKIQFESMRRSLP